MLALLLGAAACEGDDKEEPAPPDSVAFTQAGLYPEGVAYDAKHGYFLVSSQTRGSVGLVRDDGSYSVFVNDPALVSSIGLHVDDARNRLLVAVSDPGYNATRTSAVTQRKLAKLAVFNRDNKQLIALVDLGALRPALNHFANDIAVDAQGTAYVTDSFAPLIYRFDAQGTASVLVENSQLGAPAGAFGLNGIVVHPDGYLLVAKTNEGAILKVPLNNPGALSRVTIGPSLAGADGLQLADNNTLLVVCNAQARVFRLASTDGWTSAAVSGTFSTPPVYPTTLARRADQPYVLYSNLNALQANQQPPVATFSINRVSF
ncbi:SMP-30/gluconolactonase/LRE family protein [Hymenobacter coalescens]